jgi:acyl-CoA synthetase (NDP forming)
MKDRVSAVADLLSPRVVVHIGASESGIYPSDIFKSLLASPVTLYAVNPRRSEVFGQPCLASVSELPERGKGEGKADLALLTIPAAAVPAALADCIEAGIGQAVVISSGFAEAGAEGRALQAKVEALGDKIHVLGPNCAGFANVSEGIIAARLYSAAASGGISFVSQSGALMMALHGVFAEKGSGLRSVVSVGNQAGYRLSDFLAHFAGDPGTKVIAAFIEGMPDGGEFVEAAKKCLAAGKPVIAVKSGRTELGKRLAATHTAALVGEGKVFEAVCRQCGIILVDDIDELVAAASLAAAGSGSPLKNIAWISQSGGLGSLVGDLAKAAGIEPKPFPAGLGAALNPVDVGGERMRGGALRDTLKPFLAHEDVDAAVLLFAKNPNRDVEIETAAAVIAARDESGKPVIVVWVGPSLPPAGGPEPGRNALRVLGGAGIPLFNSPGPAVKALGRLKSWRAFRAEWTAAGLAGRSSLSQGISVGPGRINSRMLGQEETLLRLEKAGIPFVRSVFVPADPGGAPYAALVGKACDAAESLLRDSDRGSAVVLKLIASGFSHKSDAGFVALDLADVESLKSAALGMLGRIPENCVIEGFLVQPMVRGGREVFIGAQADPQFGPVIAFGPGGVLVELLKGVDFLRPPFREAEARLFVKRNPVWPLLAGVRGAKPADTESIVKTLVALGDYMLEHADSVTSMDLNPFLVFDEGSGGFALDARIEEAGS